MIRTWFPVDRWASAQSLVVTRPVVGRGGDAGARRLAHANVRLAFSAHRHERPSLLLVALWYLYARDRRASTSASRRTS